MSVKIMMAVAAGGAIGAVGRYGMTSVAAHWFSVGFPYGTLLVNLIGSFVLGLLFEASILVWSPQEELRAFLFVGVLGGFTTFSGFSLDVYQLWSRGDIWLTAIYVGVSVVLCILCFFAGLAILRAILT